MPYEKDFVKDAPNVGDEEELSQDDEAQLAQYYGLSYSERRSDTGLPEGGTRGTGRPEGRTSGGTGGKDAMTRSEGKLDVEKKRRPSELVRLKKHVVTEPKQVTVPVQREEVRVEREPITDANRGDAMSGPDITESTHDVVLNEEEVEVSKRTVPKERVRLDKDVSTEQRQVSEEVRKEEIEVERNPKR